MCSKNRQLHMVTDKVEETMEFILVLQTEGTHAEEIMIQPCTIFRSNHKHLWGSHLLPSRAQSTKLQLYCSKRCSRIVCIQNSNLSNTAFSVCQQPWYPLRGWDNQLHHTVHACKGYPQRQLWEMIKCVWCWAGIWLRKHRQWTNNSDKFVEGPPEAHLNPTAVFIVKDGNATASQQTWSKHYNLLCITS